MSQVSDLLAELSQIVAELQHIAQEGVPGAGQALGTAERLRAEAATLVREGRRNRGSRDQDARERRREELARRVAALNTRLDEIDILLA